MSLGLEVWSERDALRKERRSNATFVSGVIVGSCGCSSVVDEKSRSVGDGTAVAVDVGRLPRLLQLASMRFAPAWTSGTSPPPVIRCPARCDESSSSSASASPTLREPDHRVTVVPRRTVDPSEKCGGRVPVPFCRRLPPPAGTTVRARFWAAPAEDGPNERARQTFSIHATTGPDPSSERGAGRPDPGPFATSTARTSRPTGS